ncbi:stage II sporulation protein D [Niallia endozanthoxylica]|uniref:Stage II sporulation protein D n=1 Tax=Niallia endozanthoxylica TaxID=2036016 RepID=A0A5J5I007_9BACI|nr:stage II sporulation protein D [Niallia endozanthoxylica]KAA9027805.1 stage II sporulation protein D [Niallia endozanthoxylica]
MKKFKPVVLLAALLFIVTLMIPTFVVLPFGEEKVSGKLGEDVKEAAREKPEAEVTAAPSIDVAVYRTAKQDVESIPLEEYVAGVVASEMPADFEKEALKAQALTARTYIVKQLMSNQSVELPKDANVADTEFFQVYKSPDELKQIWGPSNFEWKMEKIKEAVRETQGQILTYDGTPIDATFFSTSNGYTESSEAIWPNSLPYLKSVESPWDKQSPKYNGQKIISVKDFEAKLGVKLSDNKTIGAVIERTEGKRVAKVNINGKEVSGKDIRNKLGLMSTDFTWERRGDNIVINTKGYGHGVGMSQYGANGMAKEGKKYADIVQYYYQGVQIADSEPFITTITAKK